MKNKSLRFIHTAWAGMTAGAIAAAPLPAGIGDWPQWGGTNQRNMYSPATGLPDEIKPGQFKPGTEEVDPSSTKNVRWVAKLGSQTYGNPTVVGGKVYRRDQQRVTARSPAQGRSQHLALLDEKTGDLLWQLVVPKLASGKVNDWEFLGILSSPRVEGNAFIW
jgi:hypothetical protein